MPDANPWKRYRDELNAILKAADPLLGQPQHPIERSIYAARLNWPNRIKDGKLRLPFGVVMPGSPTPASRFTSPVSYQYQVTPRLYYVVSTVDDLDPLSTLDKALFLMHQAAIGSPVITYVDEPAWDTSEALDLNQQLIATGIPALAGCMTLSGIYGWVLCSGT